MLTDTKLRDRLVAKINTTEDNELLKQISRFIDLEMQMDEVYKLSPDELAAVKEGIDQIDNGLFFTDQQANEIFDKCLGK